MGPERREDMEGSSEAGKTFQTKKPAPEKMWKGDPMPVSCIAGRQILYHLSHQGSPHKG